MPGAENVISQCEEIKVLKEDVEDEEKCIELLNDYSGWNLNINQDGIRVDYKGTG